MIKKFKNWYNNLLSFQKARFWSVVIGIILYIILVFISILRVTDLNSLFLYIFFILPLTPLGIIFWVAVETIDKEASYNLKKKYKDAEDEINVWFDSTCSNCVKLNIKSTESSAEILYYYHSKHLSVNSFYVEREKSISGEKTKYYIYADCEGKEDRVIFPKEITNAEYILASFALAN